MKISVNILCLDTWDTLEKSLPIIINELSSISYEIIIVDNGSKDKLKDMQEGQLGNHIRIIRNQENLGISKGKNLGILVSKGEYILLLDGDIVPVPNSIIKLIEHLNNHKECDAIGFLPNKFALHFNKNHEKYHEDFCHVLFNPRIGQGTCCLYYGIFRNTVFDKVLMSEEGEFGKPGYGWEDHDFFEKMKQAGINQWFCGMNHESGKYYHKINSSIRSMGHSNYTATSKARGEQFKNKWAKVCLTS